MDVNFLEKVVTILFILILPKEKKVLFHDILR